MASRKGGERAGGGGGAVGLQVELKQQRRAKLRSHTVPLSLAHWGCLNPDSPPANRTVVSSGWQGQVFSTCKHSEAICQTLPLRMSMCLATDLVTGWRQRPRRRQHFEMKSSVGESMFKWYFPARFQMLSLASHATALFQIGLCESLGARFEITLNE